MSDILQNVFMDESGDLGFGVGSNYMILAFISPQSGKELSKVIKNFNGHLISNGWDRNVEIKAANLWHSPKNPKVPAAFKYKNNPDEPMKYVITKIAGVRGVIEYVAVKLDTVSGGLKMAPTAILYNYFAWQLLKGPLCYFPTVCLYVDRRNREYHNMLKFDGYIESKTGITRAEKNMKPISLKICHYHANSCNECKAEERSSVEFGMRGLQAVDFVCWALKRKFEDGSNEWYSLVEKRVRWKQHLYFEGGSAKKSS